MSMSSKNVALQKAVYDALIREKRSGESFTKLLARLMSQREAADDLWGAWGPHGFKEDLQALRRLRRLEPERRP
jgi:predicted CopG family antitoxin